MFMSQGLRYTSTVTSFISGDGGLLAKKSVLVKSLAQRETIRENDSLWVRSEGEEEGEGRRVMTPVTLSLIPPGLRP